MARNAIQHGYYPIAPSPWPIIGAIGTFCTVIGSVFWMHGSYDFFGLGLGGNPAVFFGGIALLLYTLVGWRYDIARESIAPDHRQPAALSRFRSAVLLIVVAEALFFSSWIWAYFYSALFHADISNGSWPPENFVTFDPWGLPLFNTLLVLTSCTAIFWARHAMVSGDNKGAFRGVALTIALGTIFLGVQAYEYLHAPFAFGMNGAQLMPLADVGVVFGHLTPEGGNLEAIYGSTIIMVTGLHALHIAVAVIFLIGCLAGILAGRITPQSHLGFAATAWFWYFGAAIWLVLFAGIYVWGSSDVVAAAISR